MEDSLLRSWLSESAKRRPLTSGVPTLAGCRIISVRLWRALRESSWWRVWKAPAASPRASGRSAATVALPPPAPRSPRPWLPASRPYVCVSPLSLRLSVRRRRAPALARVCNCRCTRPSLAVPPVDGGRLSSAPRGRTAPPLAASASLGDDANIMLASLGLRTDMTR